jgi:hypothetical protein
MTVITVEQLYEQHIKPMPIPEQLRLVVLITQQLAEEMPEVETAAKPKRSLMELHGLGAEIWQGVDAQEYVNELRQEWDHRP